MATVSATRNEGELAVPPVPPVPSSALLTAPLPPSRTITQRRAKKEWIPSDLPKRNWIYVLREQDEDGVVSIHYRDGFSDAVVLDPALEVDKSLLRPLSQGERRYNLEISSDGNIDIDVWLASSEGLEPARTTILLQGAEVSLRLHSVGDRPVDIVIIGTVVSLSLPRGFCGRLKSDTSRECVSISPPLLKAVPFAIYQDVKDHLVATFGAESDANGSTVDIRSSYSNISLHLSKYKQGFFKSLFGRS